MALLSWTCRSVTARASRVTRTLFVLVAFMASVELLFHGPSIVFNIVVPRRQPASPEEVHFQRRAWLRAGCAWNISTHPSVEDLIKHPDKLSNFIYNDEHKLIYCYVPKVACTQWKKVLAVVAGTLPDKPLEQYPQGRPHGTSLHRFLSQLAPAEARRRLHTYTTAVFVRHPLERLVSAYLDKFQLMTNSKAMNERFYQEIVEQQRPWVADAAAVPADEARITFAEFADWVSKPEPPTSGPSQEHWQPAVQLCHPCSVRYDYVGHMETLERDAALVLRAANISHPRFPADRRSHTGPQVAPLMATLAPHVAEHVLQKYADDFVVFGYKPSWTELASVAT